MQIDPTWPTMLTKAINTHFDYHLKEVAGVPLIFANQASADYEKLPRWVEIAFFGPLFDSDVRSVNATLKVMLRLFIKNPEGIYTISDLEGLVLEVASKPINISDLGRCFQNLGFTVKPKGRLESPKAAVASEVSATYSIQLKE